ncbi:ketosteroid isomerase-related protein [Luteibacter sp. CQ10]|uniref:ketosteroid isomerase-related protein n=1 Tax=Luteibacter sp. CQ10 TaxID=2805821 RepID=UPI0034A44B97
MNDTIDLIRRYYAAFNRGDWKGMLDLLDENVHHDVNQGGRETGRDRFAAFLERMNTSYSEELKNVVIMANEAGDRAAAEYVVHGEYKATDDGLPLAQGQSYVLPGGAFFEVRNGRIARVTNYYNLEDWLAQVRRVEVD